MEEQCVSRYQLSMSYGQCLFIYICDCSKKSTCIMHRVERIRRRVLKQPALQREERKLRQIECAKVNGRRYGRVKMQVGHMKARSVSKGVKARSVLKGVKARSVKVVRMEQQSTVDPLSVSKRGQESQPGSWKRQGLRDEHMRRKMEGAQTDGMQYT